MKGAILKVCPQAIIVDITHSIPPQDVGFAARVLADTYPHFPKNTVHVSVVDPGVGTQRRIIAAECDNHVFIAPDNGLLTLVVNRSVPFQIVEVTNMEFWSDKLSSTFHGRDIMAPVAARVANGIDLPRFGRLISVDSLQRVTIAEPTILANSIEGQIIAVDSFGNLISNIRREQIPISVLAKSYDSPLGPSKGNKLTESTGSEGSPTGSAAAIRITIGDLHVDNFVSSYGFAEPGAIVALFGSSDYLEIAQVNGHAANSIRQRRGATIRLQYFR